MNLVPAENVAASAVVDEVLNGLLTSEKALPAKLFYDKRGSELFDEICRLEEYYQTRTELGILKRYLPQIISAVGPRAQLVEYGSGSSAKTKILLQSLIDLASYLPIDISRDYLSEVVAGLRAQFPKLEILPVCADYTKPFTLPSLLTGRIERRVFFFPGSTIGNLEERDAIELLARTRRLAGPNGGLIVGVDLQKDLRILEAAYNDSRGVTAEFNKNVLRRLNDEFGANISLPNFAHQAFYNEPCERIEMHLVSLRPQTITVAGHDVFLREGETIHTENSYKYSPESFEAMAKKVGFSPVNCWVDDNKLFAVYYLA